MEGTMPQYMYALHDFVPENEDEIDFRAGERIEVIERDDLYDDGWWHGRNLAGKIGLFPQSYTTPAPPPATNGVTPTPDSSTPDKILSSTSVTTSTVLQPLAEESESESPVSRAHDIVSPVPRQPPASFLNANDSDEESLSEQQRTGGDGGMMKATLTDVQKAIEQLGRNRADGDGGRSFSFASTRDGGETDDTDFELSDVDGGDTGTQGQDWHKGARRKLAEKARQAVEDAERLEAMMERSTAPPIDVELSDESEDEGDNDYTARSTAYPRAHPHIPEEDEEEAAEDRKHVHAASTATTVTPQPEPAKSNTTLPSQTIAVPHVEQPEVITATQPSFTNHYAPQIEKTVTAPHQISVVIDSITTDQHKRNSAPTPISQPLSSLPSPTASTHASGFRITTPFQVTSAPSTASVSTNPTSFTQRTSSQEKKDKKPANEWTLDEVVEWLKSKGFDQDVCDKFIEQEITGDVLLELDVNVLKTEIGIVAFGKRMRIANAITDLRRPPSIGSFEPPSVESTSHTTPPSVIHHHNGHARSLSHSHSVHSYPGTPLRTQSIQGSSPQIYALTNGPSSNGHMSAPSEVLHMNTASAIVAASAVAGSGIGLGFDGMPPNGLEKSKGRPSQLTLSPSEGNLKSKVIIETSTIRSNDDSEDRAHLSDGDVTHTNSVRRRIFGRSHDSSMSISNTVSSRNSKDGSGVSPAPGQSPSQSGDKEFAAASVGSTNTVGSRHKTKRSLDKGERLSIFGNTFGGSLGKGRKPPPSEDGITDSKSSSMFSRLHSSSGRKSSVANHNRPSTPSGSPKSSPIDAKDRIRNVSAMTTASSATAIPDLKKKSSFDDRRASGDKAWSDRATLRKRTVSGPASGGSGGEPLSPHDGTGEIQQGLSILEQVGEPDHTGFMRKKGLRYNSWKLRYCVLKGEHLYVLRSNNKSETRLKGYVNIRGYKVTVDENLGPGRYGFRIDHDHDKTHYFSSDEKGIIRDWMKAIMKATIGRDYTKPVVSSCNIPTIPLVVAQAMNPAPRPPSPTARDATQKALRRENPHQLSSRDAHESSGVANGATTPKAVVPPRPSREMRRMNSIRSTSTATDEPLIDWGNSHLPESLQVFDPTGPLFSGLGLLRIAESIKGKPASPPVSDSAFPSGPTDDKLDGLFKLFDFLLDNDVKMGSVSINDVRQGKRDKIVQLLKALKAWEDKRRALAFSMGSSVQAGSFMGAPSGIQYA